MMLKDTNAFAGFGFKRAASVAWKWLILGDINYDFKVDIRDLVLFIKLGNIQLIQDEIQKQT
jgi:hypothetical protein